MEHLDVLVIGAGLSGIGTAVHLQEKCPDKRYAIVEMREAIGGTWDLFRYPGIRSDSDMYTLGYHFKPWTNPKAIADGPDILAYIRETAAEYGVEEKIRYRHKVLGLDWSAEEGRWHVTVERLDDGERLTISSRYVMCCAGYYNYDQGHTPHFERRDDFEGTIIHPQRWPEDLDYRDKTVVVIGSGATAVTLVPALAEQAEHVVMLQRSPTYMASIPRADRITGFLRDRGLPERVIYALARAHKVLYGITTFGLSRRFPEFVRSQLLREVKRAVGEDIDMDHFSPRYDPWDERLCAVPDGDMFEALRDGRASVVTEHVDRFVPEGLRLASGEVLKADIIVTATGLELKILGGAELTLDGEPVTIADKFYYRGAMLEDVPNMALVFGYTNSSWTLKADLIADFFCRLIQRMDVKGYEVCTPRAKGVADGGPFLNLSSGYIRRAAHLLPRQGAVRPWKLYQNYIIDYTLMKLLPLDDGALVFTNPERSAKGRQGVARSAA